MKRLVAIVGPTASGKSAIVLELARQLGGEIVNGDSRQVYRGMEIGTAAPTPDDLRAAAHHLYGFRDPADPYSLALYQRDARAAFEAIWARGAVPWLVGGTGQYVRSLLEAWSVPEVPPDGDFRARHLARAAEEGEAALHAELAAIDPAAAAAIDRRNVRRVIRALEVFAATGIPISTWQTRRDPDFTFQLFGIDVPLDELDLRIDARVERMFAEGLVEEVRALLGAGLSRDSSAMGAIGYGQVADHLAGIVTREEAIAATQQATRRLARNQLKWFRKDDTRITWVSSAGDVDAGGRRPLADGDAGLEISATSAP